MRYGSLFSGYGGLDLAVEDVFGAKAAWHSEIEPAACRVLERRWPGVPNLGDVAKVDWSEVEPVEIMCGGFPCTDLSAAGKLAGLKPGTRSGLWSEFARGIKVLRPSLVVIENVRGLTSAPATHPAHELGLCPGCLGVEPERVVLRALGAVLGDLADLGFDAEWLGLPASDIGAAHPRFRIVILAWPATQDAGGEPRIERWSAAPGQAQAGWTRADTGGRGDAPAADPEVDGLERRFAGRRPAKSAGPASTPPSVARGVGNRRGEGWAESAGIVGGSDVALGGEPAAADPVGHGCEGRAECDGEPVGGEAHDQRQRDDVERLGVAGWGEYGPAIRRWESVLGRVAPAPVGVGARGGPKLSARFVEWLMGLPDGWVTDCGVTTNEALKMLGNGVVPQQLAAGIRLLLERVEGA